MPVVPVMIAECVSTNDGANVVDVSNDQVRNESEDTQSDESMNDDESKWMDEPQQDVSLSDCWSMARQGKGNFVVPMMFVHVVWLAFLSAEY